MRIIRPDSYLFAITVQLFLSYKEKVKKVCLLAEAGMGTFIDQKQELVSYGQLILYCDYKRAYFSLNSFVLIFTFCRLFCTKVDKYFFAFVPRLSLQARIFARHQQRRGLKFKIRPCRKLAISRQTLQISDREDYHNLIQSISELGYSEIDNSLCNRFVNWFHHNISLYSPLGYRIRSVSATLHKCTKHLFIPLSPLTSVGLQA